ncbi:hypothetical protein Agub_g3138, partial [Astrephomene gubernaculifera]
EHLAKVAWAYAKVGIPDERLFEQLSAATLALLAPYLKRVEDAAAAAPSHSSAAAVAAAIVAGGRAPLDAVAVSNLVWAFVRTQQAHPELLAALASVAAPYKGLYDNDQLALLARSYAAIGHYDEALCAAFSMVACRRLRHLSGPQLSGLLGALARLGHRDEQLAGAGAGLARALAQRGREGQLGAQEACELLWAVAQLGLDPGSPGSSSSGAPAVLGLIDASNESPSAAAPFSRRRAAAGVHPDLSPTIALAAALRGRCGELPPGDLARALWALSVVLPPHLPPARAVYGRGGGGGWGEVRQLVRELTRQLGGHPVESYSRE